MASRITLRRRLQRVGVAFRNLPLILLCCAISVSIEVFAAGGIFQMNHGQVSILGFPVQLAPVEALISLGFGLLALWLATTAAALKADPRREQQRRAGRAQLLAVLLLFPPIYYAGNCFAYQRQVAEWREYSGSAAEAADRALANDPRVESRVREDAAIALQKGMEPKVARLDLGSMTWAALLYLSNMLAARFGWRPPPETPAQARAREQAIRAAKARWTREQNKKLKAKAEAAAAKSGNVHKLFG